jgi:hypothetical protein
MAQFQRTRVAIVNPYEVSHTQEPPRPGWISPVAVAIVMAMFIGTYGLARWLGPHGLASGLYTSAFCYFTLSLSDHPAFRPINYSRMTVVELIVVIAICAILHGLMMPTVIVRCRQNSYSAAPQSSSTVANDGSQLDISTEPQSDAD